MFGLTHVCKLNPIDPSLNIPRSSPQGILIFRHPGMANSEDNVDGDRYFRNEDTPSDLAQTKQLVDGFVEYHRTAHRRVVLVTVSLPSN